MLHLLHFVTRKNSTVWKNSVFFESYCVKQVIENKPLEQQNDNQSKTFFIQQKNFISHLYPIRISLGKNREPQI